MKLPDRQMEENNITSIKSSIRVMLVEDHSLVRAALMLLVENLEGVEAVGETGDGHSALAMAEKLRPDIVLMDITLPGVDGLEVTRRLRLAHPDIRVLMLSMHSSSEFVAKALRHGACGYLLKESASSELEVALRAIMRGDKYFSPIVSGHIVDQYLKNSVQTIGPLSCLTVRQREVFDLIVQGYNTKGMATRLGVSPKTVETHRHDLMERLDIHDIAGLTRLAINERTEPADTS